MKAKTKTEETQRAKQEAQELPTDYLCIEPREEDIVFNWLNGVGSEDDRDVAEVHLRMCYRCQETVVHLMEINEEFKRNAGRFLHLAGTRHEQRLTTLHPGDEGPDNIHPSKSMKMGGGN